MQFIGRDPELKCEVFHCLSCGLIQSPRVGSLYLKNFYASNYRKQVETFSDRYREFMDKRGDAQYNFVLSSSPGKFSPKRVLDVGAGIGSSLIKYKGADELIAIEYDKKCIEEIESRSCIKVFNETLVFSPKYKDYFDLIILSHVFEHVNDPLSYLYKLHSVLAPNGLVFIEVPNEPLALVNHNIGRGRREGHLFNYTPSLLNSMIAKSKLFEILSMKTFSIDVASYIEGGNLSSEWGPNSSGDGVHIRALLQKNESSDTSLFTTFVDSIVQSRERDIIFLSNKIASLEESEKKQLSVNEKITKDFSENLTSFSNSLSENKADLKKKIEELNKLTDEKANLAKRTRKLEEELARLEESETRKPRKK